jgi:hypothetical protein
MQAMRSSHKWLYLSIYLSIYVSLYLVPLQIRGLVLRIGCWVWEIAVAEGGAGALLAPRPSRGRSYAYSPHRLRDPRDPVFLEWPWRQPPLCWSRVTPTYWPSVRQFEPSRSWPLRIANPGRPLTAEPSPKDVGFGLLLSPRDPAGTVH